MARKIGLPLGLVLLAAGLLAGLISCAQVLLNQTAVRTGNVTVVFINDTPFTAAFSYGMWDAWDRSPPGQIEMQQLVLAANSTSSVATLTCARNFSVATQAFIDRANVLNTPTTFAGFNPDAYDSVLHFSNIAPGSPGAALPTVGTALGIERLLGVDYECGDELVVTLVQDPDAAGGFRADFSDIKGPETTTP